MKITDEQLNGLLEGMDLEQPSMSFNRKVMDQVKLEIKPVAMKTQVDTRIIYGIASVFLCSIAGVLAYVLMNTNFNYSIPKIDVNLDGMVHTTLTSGFLKAFLFTDAVIALILFDRYWKLHRG